MLDGAPRAGPRVGVFINEHLEPSSYRFSASGADGEVLWPTHIFQLEDPGFWTEALQQLLPQLQLTAAKAALSHANHHTDLSAELLAASQLSPAGQRAMCDSEVYGHEWGCFGYPRPAFCAEHQQLLCCQVDA